MSWSVSFLGKPEAVAKALEEESARLTGQSKTEYDAALPHLVGLVKNNFVKAGSGHTEPLVNLSASGSGMTVGGEQSQRQCTVRLETMWTKLLI